MTTNPRSTLSRRHLLLWAAASVTAACGRDASTPPPTGRAPISPTAELPTPTPIPAVPDLGIAGRRPQQWGADLPGIHTTVLTDPQFPTLALTFDACGTEGSLVDVPLLDILRRERVAATMFLNEHWVRANMPMIRRLSTEPLFRIGNHGSRHVPLSVTGRSADGITGTTSAADVVDEVLTNQQLLQEVTGIAPYWFRSGTAYYDDVAVEIAAELGVALAGFSVDGGTAAMPRQVADAVTTAPDGAIVRLRMDRPFSGTAAGLRAAISALRERGTHFVHLPQPHGTPR